MFRIVKKEELAKDITKLSVEAPQIAQKAKAGQFVVLLLNEQSERIPLTLSDWDKHNGTITLIFQKVGFSTKQLGGIETGGAIRHILGPLGHSTDIQNIGQVYCIAGGVGIAEIYPVSRAFKEAGNRVLTILGSRSKELLILEKELRNTCDELFIATDDGSYGRKGVVTDILKELLAVVEQSATSRYPDMVYAIGPVKMMRAVSELTKDYGIKTVVSLNPIMVDATGMCGSCRCKIDGKTVFACVEGPDFDGHKVDFTELEKRLRLFEDKEKICLEKSLNNQSNSE